MDGSLSPIRLPYDTVRLAARLFLPLAFFYTLGRLAHQGVLLLAVRLSEPRGWQAYAGFAVLSLGVLVTLAAYIAMLNTVGRALGTVTNTTLTQDQRERRLVDAIAHTLLPFLVFYSAWGLFVEDVRAFLRLFTEMRPEIDPEAGAVLLDLMDVNVLIVVVTLVIYGLKAGCERLYDTFGNRLLGFGNSVLECMWMYFGIISLGNWIGGGVDWLTGRVFWADLTGLADLVPLVPQLKEAWAFLAPYRAELGDGLLQPLVWLAMAAVVHGSSVTDETKVIEGTRLEPRLSGLWRRLPAPVRVTAEFFSRGLRDKYVPVANGLRFVLRSGLVFYLVFCLAYVMIEALAAVGFMALTRLVGPHETLWWQMWEGAVTFPVDLLHEVLRICLLAAAFDLALRRAGPAAVPARPAAPRDRVSPAATAPAVS
ncbi:hypothetical protein GCM10009677_06580 [Sphaerisporangium rubeum]|uniref:Uncharacterized protein n=1 Tax=Sphaerisporangium rubeum TaxID=321317 RepID=A0A7X0IKL7_9ACTN|nr:hypothetical protein [Sphaerisporangium rubeum]MBB6476909.1 hypothetical protein [Sphaerisporangium rubeum]